MTVELNHTIIWATDKRRSADFLSGILGLPVGEQNGPFLPIQLTNQVTLDFADGTDVGGQHYAFLVNDAVFDAALARVRSEGLPYWADPHHAEPSTINHRLGGRGFYFDDPDGHNMELMTIA